MSGRQRILICDSDPVTVRFLTSLLDEYGYEPLVATTCDQGVAMVTSQLPTLVITELILPDREGFELIRAVRAHAATSRVPLLVLSLRDREEEIVRAFEEGADDYVVKPFPARELMARIRKRIEGAQSGR